MEEHVVLVDSNDQELGTMEKMEAHRTGSLHRAFSVFVMNQAGEIMLHQRARSKYHSGGLWTNTCCSHPRLNESYIDGAHRRLQEEMGFDCALEPAFSFIYKSELDNDLIEHELDHVFIGQFEGEPQINPEEVESWKYMSVSAVAADIATNPDQYTVWFKIIFEQFQSHLTKHTNSLESWALH